MLRDEALPLSIPGDHRGVLLIHGFTGSPFEMKFLAEELGKRGFSVEVPVLAGHERGDPAELAQARWKDWYATVDRELRALKRRCEHVAVVGLSLGGLLALHLARRNQDQISALGAISVPLWLGRPIEVAVPILAQLSRLAPPLAHVPKFHSDVRDRIMRERNPTMNVPLPAVDQLIQFMRLVRATVDLVRVPAFVAHGKKDHTASFACSEELVSRLGSSVVEYLVLPRSYHVATIDVERDLLAKRLGRFLTERISPCQ
ncbi:MAG: alpha/beta fold hydrolase [Deltaproteobacteria bacterium]|nr:alpha/beta fold hydrolase [Deltaproteobacteria bacterium]